MIETKNSPDGLHRRIFQNKKKELEDQAEGKTQHDNIRRYRMRRLEKQITKADI